MKNFTERLTALLICAATANAAAAATATAATSLPPEWTDAQSFLDNKGIRAEDVTVVYRSPQCTYFAAPQDSAFVLVADSRFKGALGGNAVLAFGTGNEVWVKSPNEEDQDEQDGFFLGIIKLYESALAAMEETGERPITPVGKKEIGPLCAHINYGQHLPFNRLFPKDGKGEHEWYSVAGCGPVALGQVLTYHRSPVQPKGIYTGKTMSGNPYTYNLSDYPIDWNNLNPEVLLLDCAMSLGTKLGVGYSLTLISQFKAALFDAWSYSPKCRILNQDMKETAMLKMVQNDISAKRPAILAGGHHLYVADGLQDDFLHFDFGWRGFGNGWFRMMILPEREGWQLPFTEALVGIEPDTEGQYEHVTVKLSKAGTLEKKLPENKRHLIRKLTVQGKINGADFDLIRKMAGAITLPSDYTGDYGALTELDLSDARIVATGPFYIKAPIEEIKGTVTPVNAPPFDYRYRLADISKKDWAEMEKLGIAKMYNLDLREGIVLIARNVPEGTVPSYLFSGCTSLRKVTLPKKLKRVDKHAFLGCWGLMEVANLPKDTDPQAFERSYLQ